MQLVFFVFASFMYTREMNFVQCCAAVIHLPVCRVVFFVLHDHFIPAACRTVLFGQMPERTLSADASRGEFSLVTAVLLRSGRVANISLSEWTFMFV